MTTPRRLKLSTALSGLSGLFLFASAAGLVLHWPPSNIIEWAIMLLICAISSICLAAGVSVAFYRTEEEPWLRIGIVLVGLSLSFVLAWLSSVLPNVPLILL